jgi:hypothetical protein
MTRFVGLGGEDGQRLHRLLITEIGTTKAHIEILVTVVRYVGRMGGEVKGRGKM